MAITLFLARVGFMTNDAVAAFIGSVFVVCLFEQHTVTIERTDVPNTVTRDITVYA